MGAAWLAGGSVVVKEWLYRKTMKIAVERGSGVLASNAVHHRVDSLTALVALGAIAGANVWPAGGAWLDPVGGLVVAVMVVKAGVENCLAAVGELADRGMGEEKEVEVREALAGEGWGVRLVEGVKSGQNLLVRVEVEVEDGVGVRELMERERRVRDCVGGVKGVWRVGVRWVPKGGDMVGTEFVEKKEL